MLEVDLESIGRWENGSPVPLPGGRKGVEKGPCRHVEFLSNRFASASDFLVVPPEGQGLQPIDSQAFRRPLLRSLPFRPDPSTPGSPVE